MLLWPCLAVADDKLSSKKQSARWRVLLRENPTFLRLWTKYLNFLQTNFVTFKYEAVRDGFLECIDLLRSAVASSDKDLQPDLNSNLIYVLLRCTLFMRESGFREHATAIWQALLEFNFFAPSQSPSATEESLSLFEDFWESEVPRVGEEEAKGWSNYVNEDGVAAGPEPQTDPTEAKIDRRDIFGSWQMAEESRTFHATNPARTTDDVEEDDPYRVILFSDVKPFLVNVQDPQARNSLINAFVVFCCLPPPLLGDFGSPAQAWGIDSFVRTEALEQSDVFLEQILGPGTLDTFSDGPVSASPTLLLDDSDQRDRRGSLPNYYHNFPVSTETLFSREDAFVSAFGRWRVMFEADKGPMDINWLARALRYLVLANVGGVALAEYYLAFMMKNGLGTQVPLLSCCNVVADVDAQATQDGEDTLETVSFEPATV